MIADYILALPFKFFKEIGNFLYFWYVKGSKDFWRNEIGFIKSVENDIGIFINLKLITQPIYGDYSTIGRLIGPFFRLIRVAIGSFLVFISIFFIVLSYVIWLFLPLVAFVMAFKNFLYLFFE